MEYIEGLEFIEDTVLSTPVPYLPCSQQRSQEFVLEGALLRPEGQKFGAEGRERGGVLEKGADRGSGDVISSYVLTFISFYFIALYLYLYRNAFCHFLIKRLIDWITSPKYFGSCNQLYGPFNDTSMRYSCQNSVNARRRSSIVF